MSLPRPYRWLPILVVVGLFATPQVAAANHNLTACQQWHVMPVTHCVYIRRAALSAGGRVRWAHSIYMRNLIREESGFRWDAVNSIGACGMGQMLPCRKYPPRYCYPRKYDQAWCMVHYIHLRYGTPYRAWQHWLCPRDYPYYTGSRCYPHWY